MEILECFRESMATWEFERQLQESGEKRLSLNSKLRRLAHLFIQFKKSVGRKQICTEKLQRYVSYGSLRRIKTSNRKHDKGWRNWQNKKWIKIDSLNYLVKDVCDSMHVFYLKKKANQKAADIGNYMFVASLGHLFFFLKCWGISYYKKANRT